MVVPRYHHLRLINCQVVSFLIFRGHFRIMLNNNAVALLVWIEVLNFV